MKKSLWYIFSFALLTVLFAVPNFAQNEQRAGRNVSAGANSYVISAKAGGVNYVEGGVVVARKTGRSGLLLKGDALEIGDVVSTGKAGKAEILLNPGSFARLAENSKFELTTTALEDLQLKLIAGSAIFEVITDNEFTFAVNTPKAKFLVVKTGVYRVDILSDGTSKIEVWKGKAQIGDVYATEVKSGREAVVNGSDVTVAKFDRSEKDDFEIFSKGRAKELAKVNANLQNRDVRSSLINSFYGSRWNLNDSYGLWIFNPQYGSCAFLPFGYGWNSPYGYYYSSDIWHYNLPPVIYYPPVRTPNNTNLPSIRTTPPDVKETRAGRDKEAESKDQIRPPYARVQREIGQSPSIGDPNSSSPFPNSGRQPSPSSFPPPANTDNSARFPPPASVDNSARMPMPSLPNGKSGKDN
ncbi:MAG: FecR family protein [Acidobacteriota bacterium]|nr:FecR family protein [Acidobacteriota bacterium]